MSTTRGVWKALMRLAPGRLLVKRASTMFEKTSRTGPMSRATAIIGIAAGIRAVLKLAGRSNVRVEPERAPDGARFTIRF